jgi:spermidine dehydrogenase
MPRRRRRQASAAAGNTAFLPVRAPGMDRFIARRDFLQGTLYAAASTLSGPLLAGVAGAASEPGPSQDLAGYYPPSLTGLRGSHPGSFESAHALRDGAAPAAAVPEGDSYDLVIVGAGLSGLSAAHFYRSAGRRGRILILDNHDDFGGHAKRNEFALHGHVQLVNGGTLDIDSPRPYSAVASGLLRELGVDVPQLSRKLERRHYYEKLGMRRAAFFDAQTFGADKLVTGLGAVPMRTLLRDAPLTVQAREDLARLEDTQTDYLAGLTAPQKKAHLAAISYLSFLREHVKLAPDALAYCQTLTHGEWGVGIDAVSALDLWGYGFPGFKGLRLPRGSTPLMSPTAAGYHESGGSARLHFPDGNATLARLLVRRLIAGVATGTTAEDVVTARFDYARLDRPGAPVRLRLNSTVVRVRHVGDPASAREVEVTYLRAGRAGSVRARHCVLACWNMMIPYLCPELPAAQRTALRSLVKAPLVYANVGLRHWRSFKSLGVREVYAPGSYFTNLYLNPKVDIGTYRASGNPDEPTILRMERTPCQPGLSEHDQNKAGRTELLATSFATFEAKIREQLLRTLGAGGFDPAADITAITVNRWPHGYAPEFNSLFDPPVPPAQRPEVIGRARFGRISIANADSGAAAYTDAAIDQAHRAVHELLSAEVPTATAL